MSQSIRITTTTTTSGPATTSRFAVVLNRGYLRTIPGILQIFELMFGIISLVLVSIYFRKDIASDVPEVFFLTMTVSFIYGTFCLLLSCVISLTTSGLITKTIYEFIYHLLTSILLFITSIIFLTGTKNYTQYNFHTAYMCAAIIGIMNSVCYLISAVLSFRSYKGF